MTLKFGSWGIQLQKNNKIILKVDGYYKLVRLYFFSGLKKNKFLVR